MSEISEACRKLALFGIGAIAISQEKIEEFTQDMIKKGEINREEGKKFVLDFMSEKNKQCKVIEEQISQKVKDAVESTGVASKRDIDDLSKNMEDLSNRIGKIETAIERLKQI